MKRVRNLFFGVAIGWGSLVFADAINPADLSVSIASSSVQPDLPGVLKWDPKAPKNADTNVTGRDPEIAFDDAQLFTGFGESGVGGGDADSDGDKGKDNNNDPDDHPPKRHFAIPEPSTFLMLGTALIYCSRLIRQHLVRG